MGNLSEVDIRKWRKYPFVVKQRLKTYEEAINKVEHQDDDSESDCANIKLLKSLWLQIRQRQPGNFSSPSFYKHIAAITTLFSLIY